MQDLYHPPYEQKNRLHPSTGTESAPNTATNMTATSVVPLLILPGRKARLWPAFAHVPQTKFGINMLIEMGLCCLDLEAGFISMTPWSELSEARLLWKGYGVSIWYFEAEVFRFVLQDVGIRANFTSSSFRTVDLPSLLRMVWRCITTVR